MEFLAENQTFLCLYDIFEWVFEIKIVYKFNKILRKKSSDHAGGNGHSFG